MNFRIREVAKRRGVKLQDIAAAMDITYIALYSQLKGKINTANLKKIADVLEVNPVELIEAGEGYSHFYDDSTGEWLGVRKI